MQNALNVNSNYKLLRHKNLKKILAILIGILFSILLILILETAAHFILKAQDRQAAPLLFDANATPAKIKSYQQRWGKELVVSYLDPTLGFAHDPNKHPLLREIPGFVRYSTQPSASPAMTIAALGGSTTDFMSGIYLDAPGIDPQNPENWVKSLSELMADDGIDAELLNGGVAGYSSNQELLKLVRDVIPMDVDLIICLEGVNEVGFLHSWNEHPMIHHYQRSLFGQLAIAQRPAFLPNLRTIAKSPDAGKERSIKGVHHGPAVDTTPARQWEKNFRIMHSIAQEYGIKYYVVLQPIMGYGKYDMSDEELNWLEAKGDNYQRMVSDFYEEAQEISKQYSYCIDLSDAYEGQSNMYLDPRHQNIRGIQVLAEKIYEALISQHAFEKN